VLFFGDSLTLGVGDLTGLGWVGRVVTACHERGLAMTAYNLGVRGDTSAHVTLRLASEALPRIAVSADCRIVLCTGINDTTVEEGRQRLSTEETLAAYARSLEHAACLEMPSLVLGLIPVSESSHRRRVASLSRRLEVLCAKTEVPYLSAFTRLQRSTEWAKALADGDGAHPTGHGYQLLADTALDAGLLGWFEAIHGADQA
jgi:acyl-CoA thioesterase I